MDKLTLTNEQLDFMLQHHAEIERSYDLERRGQREESLKIIRSLNESAEYKRLFGAMDWDDAYDRYEDRPDYDSTLRDKSIRDIQGEIESGQFSPLKDTKMTNPDKESELDSEDLDDLGLMRLEELLDIVDDQ